jgi:nucleotide-binding universal stress UspA family protein
MSMKTRMKILVAYDGSESADAALDELRNAGVGATAEVLVMSLADVFLPPPSFKGAHERALHQLRQSEALAKEASEKIASAFPNWSVRYEALADSPAWAVINKADEWQPDLIVMGARGHSVLGGRLILGSISQRVVYEARCSVRIARGPRKRGDTPLRLLIAIDNSADANAAVDAVCNRDWPKGTETSLLTVVDTVMKVPNPSDPARVRWIEAGDEGNWDEVRDLFAPAAQKLRDAGLHTEVLIERGNPADQIVEEAQSWGADCIFVGARGTRGIDRLLLGSVSSAVAARAFCSVEVVRPNRNRL